MSARYRRAADLRVSREGRLDIARAGDAAVAVDAFVRRVLDACDGRTFAEAREVLNRGACVPSPLLRTALAVLTRAGLLVSDEPAARAPAAPPPASESPLVSVVILNHNGRRHLEELLPTVLAQTHAPLETIVVDNASRDDSVAFVQQRHPGVKLVRSRSNAGFSRGVNLGIAAAAGRHLFLLNNDTTLDPACVARLVEAAGEPTGEGGRVGAVAARMMLYDNPRFVNAMGNAVSPTTWGIDAHLGALEIGQFRRGAPLFSACFGAALIPREALEAVGLPDAGYGFYYEDADWCWRARLLGLRIVAAPDAVVYHKFSATMGELPRQFKLRHAARSRLRFALKNLEPRTARRFVANYALREDLPNFAGRLAAGDAGGALAYLRAYAGLLVSLPGLLALRRRTQRGRLPAATDAALLAPLDDLPAPQVEGRYPVLGLRNLRSYYLLLRNGDRSLSGDTGLGPAGRGASERR